jgi:hypothetical protein
MYNTAQMSPIYFTLNPELSLMIIPDTLAHLDGHAINTHTYSIFLDTRSGNPLIARSKESSLHLEEIDDPSYCGYLTFELPGKLFNYTPDGQRRLSSQEVQQLIGHLSDIRDNPGLWSQQ